MENSFLYDIKILTSESDIVKAKHFVFHTYSEVMNWRPTPGNPSGFREENIQGLPILTDDFDDVSTWYGVYINNQIVGCTRTCGRRNGLLEAQLYSDIPEPIISEIGVEEMNRFATSLDSFTMLAVLVKYILQVRDSSSFSLFSTTGINPVQFFQKLGWLHIGKPFRYPPYDGDEVHMVYTTSEYDRKQEIQKLCTYWISRGIV